MHPLETPRYLRRTATTSEVAVWEIVRDRRLLGLKFRRQHRLGQFVADFYCTSLRLVLEIDGGIHKESEQMAKDRERDEWMQLRGYRVLRLKSEGISYESIERALRAFQL